MLDPRQDEPSLSDSSPSDPQQPDIKRSPLLWHSTIVLLCFFSLMLGGMLLNPASFHKFFFLPVNWPIDNSRISYYWDVASYAHLALKPACSAFYPLWPNLIRQLFSPTTIDEAARYFLGVASLLFIVSIPLLLITLRKTLKNDSLALGIALLYTLSPMAIFRVIGYTESLFSLLSLCLLFLLVQDSQKPRKRLISWILGGLFCLSGLLSLTRPILLQIGGASIASLVCVGICDGLTSQQYDRFWSFWSFKNLKDYYDRHHFWVHVTLALILGALVGYSVYGLFCWQENGDFFSPFTQQKLWNKKLAFYPRLLFSSRSPLVDLLGLYFPFLLGFFALHGIVQSLSLPRIAEWIARWIKPKPKPKPTFKFKLNLNFNLNFKLIPVKISAIIAFYPPLWIVAHLIFNQVSKHRVPYSPSHPSSIVPSPEIKRQPLPPWANQYAFWFCLYFAAAHSVLVFFTQNRLVSLARYVFGQPFVFFALAYLFAEIDRKPQRFLLSWGWVISGLFLLDQWLRYGVHKWLG